MRIYPAIDIKGGNCVRLYKGRFSDVTIYGNSPEEMALKWQDLGAEYIHVVDLDGALRGRGVNENSIREICRAVSVPVQCGGGIRSMEDIERKLSLGVSRVIIGTKAVSDRIFVSEAVRKYGDKIVIGVDAKDGKVVIEGWEKLSEYHAVEFAQLMESLGVKTIVYTDVSTDGTLSGPNISAMREMVEKTNLKVIASGGVGDISHIEELKKTGVDGVIIGKALYTDKVDLREAIKACE